MTPSSRRLRAAALGLPARPARRGGEANASRRVQERREGFERYKKDVKEKGKPFFPTRCSTTR